MRVITRKFDPSLRTPEIAAPARSTVVEMRMSPQGECVVVFSTPDEEGPEERHQLLVLFEHEDHMHNGIDPAQWRHVGSWRYPNGYMGHGFAAVASPRKSKPGA